MPRKQSSLMTSGCGSPISTEQLGYRYDSYGKTLSQSGAYANANLYRFSSKEFHANAGFYYYGYRWYEPNLQRWLNRDPIEEEGGINLYCFIGNDPVNHGDAYGLKEDDCCEEEAVRKNMQNALQEMSRKLEEASKHGGSKRANKALSVLNKALLFVGAAKSICNATDPQSCEEFLQTKTMTDCFLCCHSIHSLFGDEVAGVGFLGACRYVCPKFD